MVSRLPSVPSWLVGVWERRWIVRGRGARDASVTVRYVQAPDAFVDVRASATRAPWPAQGADDAAVATSLRARAPVEAFAGVATARGDVVSWHAALNLWPPADTRAAWAAIEAGNPLPTDDRGRAERRARRAVEERRGRLLEHLLVAPLHRAVALAEVHRVAVRVAKDLHLDVARRDEQPLEDDIVVCEAVGRLAAARLERGIEVLLARDRAHALAAAAGDRLDEQREADVLARGRLERHRVGARQLVVTRRHRHARAAHQLLRRGLVAHRAHRVARRADERDARGGTRVGEPRILGEEAVTRVERLGARRRTRVEQRVALEVRVARRRTAKAHALVGERDVCGARVRV